MKIVNNLSLGWSFNSLGLDLLKVTSFPATILHEMGHKAVAWAVFKNCDGQIEITPKGNGVTNFSGDCNLDKDLSFVGKFLGSDTSAVALYAAGPIVDVANSILLYKLAKKLKNSSPLVSSILAMNSLIKNLSMSLYVYDCYLRPTSGDYSKISEHSGIPLSTVCGVFLIFNFIMMYKTQPLAFEGISNTFTRTAAYFTNKVVTKVPEKEM